MKNLFLVWTVLIMTSTSALADVTADLMHATREGMTQALRDGNYVPGTLGALFGVPTPTYAQHLKNQIEIARKVLEKAGVENVASIDDKTMEKLMSSSSGLRKNVDLTEWKKIAPRIQHRPNIKPIDFKAIAKAAEEAWKPAGKAASAGKKVLSSAGVVGLGLAATGMMAPTESEASALSEANSSDVKINSSTAGKSTDSFETFGKKSSNAEGIQ